MSLVDPIKATEAESQKAVKTHNFQFSGIIMELHQLRYFLSTLNEGSFSSAAGKHRLTQQAISKSIGRLEQELGAKLFLRDGHQLRPTAVGEMLAVHARTIDAESRQFQRHLGELLGTAPGELLIGAGPTAARRLVAETVRRLLNDRPGIHVSVSGGTTRSMTPQLKRGEIDAFVSVLTERKPDPQLQCEVISRELTVLVGRAEHPLASRSRVSLADTLKFPWLGGAGMGHWGDLVRSSFVTAGLKPPVPTVKTDSMPFAYGLLACTDYLSVLPVALAQIDLDAGRLATINTPVNWSRPIVLFYRDTSMQFPAVNAFVTTLRSVAKRLARRSKGASA